MTTPTTDHLDPATLRALAKRVEAGESGRGLDAEIAVAARVGPDDPALGYVNKFPVWRPKQGGKAGLVETVEDDGRGGLFWRSPRLTTSLDAVEALRVRLLPGGGTYAVYSWNGGFVARVDPGPNLPPTSGYAPTEIAARLAALLYALEAKVEGERADA